jgi:ABC-2 type transport system permease protein
MEIPELVRLGGMDYLLTKPVPSQFLTSFRGFSLYSLTDFILALTMIGYAMGHLSFHFTWPGLLLYLVMVIFGGAISYSMSCLVMTLAFILIRVDAVWTTFFEVGEFEKYPMGIYPPPWKIIFSITLPMIIVANFPAHFALGKLSVMEVIWFFTASIIIIYTSTRFWRYGLKKYQSASS